MKSFNNLKAGNRIKSDDDTVMEVLFWDFHSTGKKILCFADGKSIYPASEFDPVDWKLM